MWFSVGLPLLLQLVVPVALIAVAAFGAWTAWTRGVLVVGAACYIVAIGVAGLWLVLPWWLPWLYGGLLLITAVRAARVGRVAHMPTRLLLTRVVVGASVLGSIAAVGTTAAALRGHRAPPTTVDVALPFRDGTYLVVNGGMQPLINAHLATLEGERFRAYRGQSYGVDLVAINRLGMRAQGVLPRDLAAYVIFGTPVVAPCEGDVVAAADGALDMPPPQPDRSHMAGNHVLIDCRGPWVLLGHLQQGSVSVRVGQHLIVGDAIGRVGNSGNTGEPHLHIHAQRPGTTEAPLGGEPLAIRLGGRFLARNHRVTAG